MIKIDGKEAAYPRLSSDGNQILYQTNTSGNRQLFVMDMQSGEHTAITTDKYNNNFPDWRYDNACVAFTSDRESNEEIYVMRNDG